MLASSLLAGGPSVYPVLLCGGQGRRLWPLSRSGRSKAFLTAWGSHSLLQKTAIRVADLGPPFLGVSAQEAVLAAAQLEEIGIIPHIILAEPESRNTAATVAAALLEAACRDPEALLLILPSDHIIAEVPRFLDAIACAYHAACAGWIVLFGITPTRAASEYGYILSGEALTDHKNLMRVHYFVEKPPLADAQAWLSSRHHVWNSGITLMHVQDGIRAFAKHAPKILEACQAALDRAQRHGQYVQLAAEAFAASPLCPFDRAVLEHATNIAVMPVAMGWNDIGSFNDLWESSPKDKDGNALMGSVDVDATCDTLIHSHGPRIITSHLNRMIVIADHDIVLIANRDHPEKTQAFINRHLAEHGIDYAESPYVLKPWGYYEVLTRGDNYQVKRIVLDPGAALSLQAHSQRSESWTIVSGQAHVICGEDHVDLEAGQSISIPVGTRHRLANPGQQILVVIEVQTGSYLREDDIIRFADDYGRVI